MFYGHRSLKLKCVSDPSLQEDLVSVIVDNSGNSQLAVMASTDARAYHTRRLACAFTPLTPKHHPLLDPDLPKEDIELVPQDLRPQGQLNWELPKKARTNLHIMLKLSNKADELLEEFHERLPFIDEVLHEWVEMRGASPTIKGREQLRAKASYRFDSHQEQETRPTGNNADYLFNMVKNLETPGRADVIYLTDAVEDELDSKKTQDIPPNIRGTEWSDFDECFIHDQGSCSPETPRSAIAESLDTSMTERKDSTLLNLRTSEWEEPDREVYLTPKVYNSPARYDADESPKEPGPFEEFWLQQVPFGPEVVLRCDDDDDEPVSPYSLPHFTQAMESPNLVESTQKQDPAHLMVPARILEEPTQDSK